MDSALAWIGQVAEWFGKFIPRRELLDTTEGAIKFIKGEPVYCEAGVHWYWPWTSTWVTYPIARQVDRLETQTLVSSDGRTFLVSGTLTYEVEDLMQLVPTTFNAPAAISEMGGTAISDVLCDMTWDEITHEQKRGTLKTKLKNKAQAELGQYGVKVVRFKLNTLAPCRVYKVSQSTASEEN